MPFYSPDQIKIFQYTLVGTEIDDFLNDQLVIFSTASIPANTFYMPLAAYMQYETDGKPGTIDPFDNFTIIGIDSGNSIFSSGSCGPFQYPRNGYLGLGLDTTVLTTGRINEGWTLTASGSGTGNFGTLNVYVCVIPLPIN